jgi:signal transduction histidine kinase
VGALVDEVLRRPQCLAPLGGAALQAALALYLTLKSGERRVRVWFAIVAFCSSLWSLSTAIAIGLEPGDEAIARGWAQVAFAAIALAGPCSLRFAAALARFPLRVPRLGLGFSVAVSATLLVVPSLTRVGPRSSGGFWPQPCWALALSTASCVPSMLSGILRMAKAWRALRASRRRRQIGWATAALAIGALGGVDAFSVFTDTYPLSWATGSLSCIVLYYAIVQHRLMAIRTFVRQTVLGLTGAISAAAMIYLIALAAAGRELPVPALGGIAFALFVITRAWVAGAEPALAKVLGWRRRRIEQAIAEFERRSLDARATAQVEAQLADSLRAGFDAQLTALVTGDRDREGEPEVIGDVETQLASAHAPVLRDHLDLGDPGAPALITALEHLRADALVPLVREGDLIGMAAVAGPALARADDSLTGDLQRLGERAARAWVNARLYQEVERRSRGLEAQVRMRTSELSNALDELRSAQAKLVEAERSSSLGLLVAGISHEINNALNFISANLPTLVRYAAACDPLLDAAPKELAATTRVADARAEVPRIIAEIGEATRRTGAIIGDLRKFARPDTERRLFRLEEGLDAALNLLRRRTDGRLDVARLYVGSPSVECYPGPLNQCFFNLLLNAVEAARSEIQVTLRERGNRGGVEVLIEDDGPGVDAALEDEIFRPFFTTKDKAAGLGLTVAKGVVERHGGSLQVSSTPGLGARVRVRLPMEAPAPVKTP